MSDTFMAEERRRLDAWLNSPDYQEKLTRRLKINDACARRYEPHGMAISLCKEDPIFFIENFLWTYDPRPGKEPNHFPFILFDYEKEIINETRKHIDGGQDWLAEKSRDMGFTWVVCAVFFWYWLYSDSFSGLLGSYKEKLVDDRTVDSLFGKLDYFIDSLPKWMLPKKFNKKTHRQKLKLINPENFNIITGDTMNPDFARGSRKSVVAMDEGASWDYFQEAWTSAGDATNCRMTFSTPKGRNAFCILKESDIDKMTIHWRLHPLKDQSWYDYQVARRTPEEVAQELDISYNKSQEGRVYPEWDQVIWVEKPYDPDLPLYVSWDFGKTDDTAMIWWQPDDVVVRIIDSYANRGKTIDFYIPFVTGVVSSDRSHQYSRKDMDVIEAHRNWQKGVHFGDPAGRFGNQVTDKTVLSVLADAGIHVNYREEAKDFQNRKSATKLLLRNVEVNKNERTRLLGAAMENAAYPKFQSGGKQEIRSIKPIHNWTSHYRSAVEYFAVNYGRYSERKVRIYDKFSKERLQSRGRLVAY